MRQKLNETYINSLVEKIINETIHEKAEQIENMLMGKETEEGNAFTAALAKTKKGEKFKVGDNTFTDTSDYNEGELGEGESVCEQCGAKGPIMEGNMCEQCSMKEGVYEEEDMDVMDMEDDEDEQNKEFCQYQKSKIDSEDDEDVRNDMVQRYEEKCSSMEKSMKDLARRPINMNEKLVGGQKRLDKNNNGRLDSEDFKMLRKSKKSGGETKEIWGALAGAAEAALPYVAPAATDWALDKMFGENVEKKNTITMTEGELINFIEKIIKEEKLKATTKHKGLATYEKAHKGSGKENEDYLKSVTKKLKDYLKDGSKGDYETEPDFFPKGNGELGDMKKKAYIPSDAVQDYVDNLTAAGQENLDYDEIHPNEDWVSDNIEGSSRTGNNPEWANTGKSDVNKKRNEIREKNMLAKIKRKAYNKAPQPVVTDETGDTGTGKLMMKLESENEKTTQKLNEEFDRMKQLLGYSQKTQ